jgi:MFS family permease
MYSKLLSSVFLPALFLAISVQIGSILLPLYLLELGAGPAVASFVTAGIGIGMVLFDVPAGFLASRFGDKHIMLAGVVLAAISSFMIAFATTPWLLFLLALVRGAGFTAWLLGLLSYLTESFPRNQRGRAIAMMGGTMRVGALIGPFVGGLIATSYGYNYAFLTAGILAVLGAAIIFLHRYGPHQRETSEHQAAVRFKQVLVGNKKIFATAGFASIGLQLMRSGRHLLIPLIGHTIGLDAATIGLIFSISAAIDMLLFYPVGAAMDRFGRKSVGVPCMTLFAIGLALLSYADSFATLLGISLLLGLANGLGSGIILTLGSDFAPRQRRSEFLGVWRLIGDAGNASAPIMIGGLVSAATLSAAALAIAAIGLSGALVLAFLVEETLRRPGDS